MRRRERASLSMNLATSGIDVTEVARRKHNSFLVQGLCGRGVGAVGGKEHSLCESRQRAARKLFIRSSHLPWAMPFHFPGGLIPPTKR